MGSGYSLLYDGRKMGSFSLNKKDLPVTIVGENQIIHKYTYDEDLEASDRYFNWFVIKKSSGFNKKVKVYTSLKELSLKCTLKKYGSVTRINDYYIFSAAKGQNLIIYNDFINMKVFDFRSDNIFKFYLGDLHDIYVLN